MGELRFEFTFLLFMSELSGHFKSCKLLFHGEAEHGSPVSLKQTLSFHSHSLPLTLPETHGEKDGRQDMEEVRIYELYRYSSFAKVC